MVCCPQSIRYHVLGALQCGTISETRMGQPRYTDCRTLPLRRHGVDNLRDLKARDARPKHSRFKAYEPGYIHIDVKYLPHLLGE
jgi:hypothetical protein